MYICICVCVCLRKYFDFPYIWLNNLPFLSAEDRHFATHFASPLTMMPRVAAGLNLCYQL